MNRTDPSNATSLSPLATSRTTTRSLLLILLLNFGACSDNGRLPVYPVSGQVMYQGKPTPDALIIFHPTNNLGETAPRPLTRVNRDGNFTLTTYEMNDGAPAGEYAVTITWVKDVDNGNTAREDIKPAKHLIPERYSKVETSGLKVEIKKERNILAPFELETK